MTWIKEEYKFTLSERFFSSILRAGRIPIMLPLSWMETEDLPDRKMWRKLRDICQDSRSYPRLCNGVDT